MAQNKHSSIQKLFRNERKFTTSILDRRQVEMMIRIHPMRFIREYPPRYVNSVYLDTHDFRSYNESISGVKDRIKQRVRWYGDIYGKIKNAHLEEKIKRGEIGFKKMYPLKEFTVNERFVPSAVTALIASGDIPEAAKERSAGKQAIVLVRYARTYWVTPDRKYRVTIDWDIEFYRLSPARGGFVRRAKNNSVILELKYRQDKADGARYITTGIPMRLFKNSKYVQAVNSVYCLR